MELPKKYLSYSQVALYLKDPNEYWLRYVEGIPQEDLPINARIGAVFHDTIGEKISVEEGKAALLALGCMPDKVRALEAAYQDRPFAYNRESEETAVLSYGRAKIKLYGFWDAKSVGIIDEYKTTDWWDEFQAQFYDLMWFCKFKKHPLVRHWKVNTANGRWTLVHSYKYKSSKVAKEKVIFAYKGITNGIWHKIY